MYGTVPWCLAAFIEEYAAGHFFRMIWNSSIEMNNKHLSIRGFFFFISVEQFHDSRRFLHERTMVEESSYLPNLPPEL